MIQPDPAPVLLILLGASLYVRAVRRLSRRGYRVPAGQQALWWTGLSLTAVGLIGPPAAWSDQLFWVHMTEHILIADLAVPFLLAGIRTPVGLFMPPKDLLVAIFRSARLRRAGSFVTRPLVALPVSVAVLYAWHLAPAFGAATRDPWVHALQHQCFVLANAIFWWPAIEPARRPLPAPLWKIGYLLAGRFASVMMGALLIVSTRPFYGDLYAGGERSQQIAAVFDQQVGGSIMMITDVVVMVSMLAVFFALSAREADRVDAAAAARGRRTPAT